MSALDHVVFILFYFKKRNEMKKKLKNGKKCKKNRDIKMDKMKRKWKLNEIKNTVNKIKNEKVKQK